VDSLLEPVSDVQGRTHPHKTKAPPKRDCPEADVVYCLRREKPSPANATPMSVSVAGSGMAA